MVRGERDRRGGPTTYEVCGNDLKDRESNATFKPDGHWEIRTEQSLAEIPSLVGNALKAKLADFRPECVRSVTEDGKLVAYLFVGSEGSESNETEVESLSRWQDGCVRG